VKLCNTLPLVRWRCSALVSSSYQKLEPKNLSRKSVAKTLAKVSHLHHKYFAKSKSEIREKRKRKKQTKTFFPTLLKRCHPSFFQPPIFLLLFLLGFPWKSFFTFDAIEIPTKFYPNFVEISMFRLSEIFISMLKSEFRFRFRFRLFTFAKIEIPMEVQTDFEIEIPISTSECQFWFRFRNRNFDSDIRIPTSVQDFKNKCRNFKASFTKISQKFSFDCLSEFRFRPSKSKSKFRLLSIISTINFVDSRN
jgi:hypothetical protein